MLMLGAGGTWPVVLDSANERLAELVFGVINLSWNRDVSSSSPGRVRVLVLDDWNVVLWRSAIQ
jgi:hypothetical protein